MPKRLSILGSTGSIGRSTLRVVERFPERFQVVALTAKSNVERLARQIEIFKPRLAVVYDGTSAEKLKALLRPAVDVEICHGSEGYVAAVSHDRAETVVAAMMGAAGLLPTLAAIDAGKEIALANKETLVMAGEIVMARAREKGVRILPVDSEHSAIFQCLEGRDRAGFQEILLTASGGPFRNLPASAFSELTAADALKHPNWEMGEKITIDSATLMNKGLEVIEAKWLFDVAPEQIRVLVHPQSIIHSMVAFRDGTVIAQMGVPDMQGAIAYALSMPERLPLGLPVPDFVSMGQLTFEAPDMEKFPCLSLAFEALAAGGTAPAVLNAANEIAVNAFLEGKLPFTGIPAVNAAILNQHAVTEKPSLQCILDVDRWARQTAETWIRRQESRR